jgi:glutaminase
MAQSPIIDVPAHGFLSCEIPIQEIVNDLFKRYQKVNTGAVATYIPESGKADPDWFGITLVTADGQVYEAGNTDPTFTIQSISKSFTCGIALEDNGRTAVTGKVWMEPTGEAFNSISLDPSTGRPLNPMINERAITTTSLVEGKSTKQKMQRMLDVFSRYTGRKMEVDHRVDHSESETGHRNRAIAYMRSNFDIIAEDPIPSLEAYFMQCSILVNCRDLGMMAATLANGGLNPLSGTRAVVGDYVESILSVMGSCGMYDAAGEWIFSVGMPAKSGVAGGIIAVLPGQLGIGVFSPRLDSHGNVCVASRCAGSFPAVSTCTCSMCRARGVPSSATAAMAAKPSPTACARKMRRPCSANTGPGSRPSNCRASWCSPPPRSSPGSPSAKRNTPITSF